MYNCSGFVLYVLHMRLMKLNNREENIVITTLANLNGDRSYYLILLFEQISIELVRHVMIIIYM